MSIPPLKNIFLLSNSMNLFLTPITGCRTHPVPLPPVRDMLVTSSTSKSWGSTITSLTVPFNIGSISAVVPEEFSTLTTGGLTISYSFPPFITSIDSRGPK